MKNSVLLFAISIVFATSCVSPKIHNSLVSENESTKKILEQKEKQVLVLSDEVEELNANVNLLKDKITALKNDSIQNGNSLFVLQNTQVGQLELPKLQSNLQRTDNKTSKFDITMELTELEGDLFGRLEYSTSLFNQSTIEQIIAHFQTLLQSMTASVSTALYQLPMLSADEQTYLLKL